MAKERVTQGGAAAVAEYRLGVNTCFAVKRWPEPEVWAAIVRDELGLSVVQHSLDLVDLDVPLDMARNQLLEARAACDDAGLDLHSTFTGLAAYSSNLLLSPSAAARHRALEWYRRVVELTAAAGAAATGGHIGALSVTDAADPERRASLLAGLRAGVASLAAHARKVGLQYLLVENLAAAREPSTMAWVEELLDDGDAEHVPVRLCLDVGHQCVPGTAGDERDPYAWLRRMGAQAPVVQLQQSDAGADHHWPFTEECNRRGRIDGRRVLDALEASAATQVALVLEIIPPFEEDDHQVLRDLVASADYWRRALDG